MQGVLTENDNKSGNRFNRKGRESWKQCTGPDLGKIKHKMKHSVMDGADPVQKAVIKEAELTGTNKKSGAGKPAEEKWQRVRKQLQIQLGSDAFSSWFGRMEMTALEGGVVSHSVPTAFLKNWILSKYREQILELWQKEDKSVLRVDVCIRSAVLRNLAVKTEDKTDVKNGRKQEGDRRIANVSAKSFDGRPQSKLFDQTPGFAGSPLDPKHTFSTFIEGNSNRMVHAAARTIADDITASNFNPLIIHAGVGLGKTHILQAIAWRARSQNSKARVLYLTAEYFMWRFASAIRDKTALTLKESLRDIDILLIDDLQFLQGQAIQAEFCHLLNELIDSARQVVVAADRPPSELESLDERVRSRLKGGVTLEIKAPDYELRKQILNTRYQEAKAEQPNLDIPEDILHYVARQVSSSGRDVEGAFNQLLVQHQFSEGNMSLEELDKILAHLIRSADSKRIRIEDIQRIVARQFNVTKHDLLSNRRTRVIVRPRQIAMYLAKVMTPRSLPEIGRRFGGRDHTTVLHAVRKIEELASKDQTLAHEVELLKRLILE